MTAEVIEEWGPRHAQRDDWDVRRVAAEVRSRWPLAVGCAVLAAALAVAATLLSPAVYTTTAQGFVSVSSPQTRSQNVLTSGSQYILQRMTSYAELAQTTEVLDPVISSLGLDVTGAGLADQIASRTVVNTTFLEVAVTDADPKSAALIADATMAQLATAINDLENGTVHVEVSGAAAVPDAPSGREPVRNGVLAAAAGLILGMGGALLLAQWGGRTRRRAGEG